jgi:hypothetical protein
VTAIMARKAERSRSGGGIQRVTSGTTDPQGIRACKCPTTAAWVLGTEIAAASR